MFAATGTNAPPGAKHSRDPVLLTVTGLWPVVDTAEDLLSK